MRRPLKTILLYVAGWTLLGLFFGSQQILYGAYTGNLRLAGPITSALADWYIWALLTPAILSVRRRVRLAHGTWWYALPLLFVAGVVIAVFKIALRVGVGQLIPGIPTMKMQGMLLSQLHINVATFWVILGIAAAFEYYAKYRERELRASQLESRLAQAQLQVLRVQLQPHFLFNTLHTISAFMQEGEIEDADRMITRLSDLLRLSLENVGAQEVRLAQEMEFLQRYLDIQQIRFQDRLTLAIEVPPDTLDAHVPSLILQPLVENAIRHGVSQRAEGGFVGVRARRVDDTLRLEVRDDGPGLSVSDDGNGATGTGLGLANTRARLEQLYGSAHRFALENATNGGLVVSLVIPFRAGDAAGGDRPQSRTSSSSGESG